MFDKTDQLGVNTIRTLSIEAVQKRTQDILVYQWVLPNGVCTLDKTFKGEQQLLETGLIVIVLYFQHALCNVVQHYIYQDTT